ncbi:hypothetical protein M9H77_07251 [Catharanthus roseus]|uniref:Uncharacterized protein n=1 Tax=Catharanthus roseus TaxID=4058 RepID=A0ACC0BUP0_CATRO|nr:hypothetical protein M9H77_07251 [Catharanthus roseus]
MNYRSKSEFTDTRGYTHGNQTFTQTQTYIRTNCPTLNTTQSPKHRPLKVAVDGDHTPLEPCPVTDVVPYLNSKGACKEEAIEALILSPTIQDDILSIAASVEPRVSTNLSRIESNRLNKGLTMQVVSFPPPNMETLLGTKFLVKRDKVLKSDSDRTNSTTEEKTSYEHEVGSVRMKKFRTKGSELADRKAPDKGSDHFFGDAVAFIFTTIIEMSGHMH